MAEQSFADTVSFRENVTYNQEELQRRRQSRLVRRAADIQRVLEDLAYREEAVIIDPRIGFHARVLQVFMQRIAPPGSGIKAGPSGWEKIGHRHTVEAVIYWLSGHGYSVIDGVRHAWQAGDFVCVPVFGWHRHVNESDEPANYVACVTVPFHREIGLSLFEDERYPDEWIFADKGDLARTTLIPGLAEGTELPDEPNPTPVLRMYREEVAFARAEEQRRRTSKVVVRGEDLVFEDTPGGRLAYVVDPRLGFHTRVMSTHVQELLPGHPSEVHRHTYEEACYVLQGQGVSIVGDARVTWDRGDAVFVPPLEWHQHENLGDAAARLLVHTSRPLTENIGLALTQHYPSEGVGH